MPTEELFLSVTIKQTDWDRTPGHSATNSQILVVYSIAIDQWSSSEKQGKQKCILMTNAKVIHKYSTAYNSCTTAPKILEEQCNHALWWLSTLKFCCKDPSRGVKNSDVNSNVKWTEIHIPFGNQKSLCRNFHCRESLSFPKKEKKRSLNCAY